MARASYSLIVDLETMGRTAGISFGVPHQVFGMATANDSDFKFKAPSKKG